MRKITASLLALIMAMSFASIASAEHYVQPGETMNKIASKYNMQLSDLISLNPHIKNPSLIHVGDYIVIRSADKKEGSSRLRPKPARCDGLCLRWQQLPIRSRLFGLGSRNLQEVWRHIAARQPRSGENRETCYF